jgi:hypothetical protein
MVFMHGKQYCLNFPLRTSSHDSTRQTASFKRFSWTPTRQSCYMSAIAPATLKSPNDGEISSPNSRILETIISPSPSSISLFVRRTKCTRCFNARHHDPAKRHLRCDSQQHHQRVAKTVQSSPVPECHKRVLVCQDFVLSLECPVCHDYCLRGLVRTREVEVAIRMVFGACPSDNLECRRPYNFAYESRVLPFARLC